MSTTLNTFGVTAEELRAAIYGQLGETVVKETELDHSYARLGHLLAAFKAGEYWRGLAYPNFDAFMLELRERFNRGRSQLYAYLSVAEKLLPLMSADDLDSMGISKAQEIKRAVCGVPGRKLTTEIIAAALNPKTTGKELRAVLAEAYNITDDNRPKGAWFDFGGAYLSSEERKLFVDTVKMTTALLGLKKETPEHIQRREILLAWASEFMGTHAVEVYGPQVEEPNAEQFGDFEKPNEELS